ncbi:MULTISPECIES: TetR/AcrR family transcriptional regulator [Aestuariibaculum]|uniref:TetR/AcrR family transcriptional regulator n=1 Tax=Aestuariibaculum lutulentum TaxID=2920935 RepID=A0ABS9RPB0_9FLAO|nr:MULTISPECIES: TetR/AcrR family transcriptional regulator [Aestuariibaculum]MCH4553954.1 TetR/AcrR family transcriptional regulator [Aestuariibaculum lutulentum]MCR8669451.1 TetR/AcrR family transcriptional regulator [Aestuariibaculum sp. M13]
MKDDILKTAAELFLNYGFKSVTMDELANALGMSKKTLYQYFENKNDLVEATTLYMYHTIQTGINEIILQDKSPIEELYEIKRFVMKHLKDEKSSPQFQLQKYYPKIYADLMKKQSCVMGECVISNLDRGVQMGLYRDTINKEFISKIYFNSMMSLKDKELFPLNNFSMHTLMNNYLEYHLRGICTPKGLEHLTEYLNNNQS